MEKRSQNVQTALDILQDEVRGKIASAREKMTDDYTMTWMDKDGTGTIFPSTSIGPSDEEMEEAYQMQDRSYTVKNITENGNVVMLELIEQYTDPHSNETYRTPLVLVLEFEQGKIKRGRHYCDNDVSLSQPSEQTLQDAYQGTDNKLIID